MDPYFRFQKTWMENDARSPQGPITCGSWIRRPENVNLVVLGRSKRGNSCPSLLQIFSFDPKTISLSSTPLVFLSNSQSICMCIIVCVNSNIRVQRRVLLRVMCLVGGVILNGFYVILAPSPPNLPKWRESKMSYRSDFSSLLFPFKS